MKPEDVPDAVVEKLANALGLAYVAEKMPEYARNLRLGLAAVLSLEEVWVGGPDALPLPPQVITHEGVFHEDGVTPLEITDEAMRAAGWKKQRRLSTGWVDA